MASVMRSAAPQRSSNLDLIRLITASAVIFGHAYLLNRVAEPKVFGEGVGLLRVKVFFVISGALLARSWMRDPHLGRYLARRALRILPALFVVVLFCAFILGPLVSDLGVREYFSAPLLFEYLSNLRFEMRYYLPGVFEQNPYPRSVNGSLWSLSVEVLMYLVLPLWLWVGVKLRAPRLMAWAGVIAICAWSLYWAHVTPPHGMVRIYGTSMRQAVHLAPFFMIGALYGVHGWHKRLSLQWALGGAVLLTFFTPTGALVTVASFLLLPYAVLALAFAKDPTFAGFSRFGDYSYGIYLWGFPVQQLLIMLWGGPMHPLLNFALALPISLGLAALSWHGVEKVFMRLRPETPDPPAAHAGVVPLPRPVAAPIPPHRALVRH